ncbi:uncharacterized protein BJX67DRAFT_361509 [Aspergillus lucknowensis]|uniref:Uncharacterized protein n=1 Tax=Aspergillus lucknowensis TaxID=176173 RepID=A0ABR4LIM9_9EURO
MARHLTVTRQSSPASESDSDESIRVPSVVRRFHSIPKKQSVSSLGSRASAGSKASRSSQVSDGSVDEGRSLFHAIDDLISSHLGRLARAGKGNGRSKSRLFPWSSETNSNSALESYKGAVVEFLWAVHFHCQYLRKAQQAEGSEIINVPHEKLVVLYDDLKLAMTAFDSSTANLKLRKVPGGIYKKHREHHVDFRNRLIDICGLPISVPQICTTTTRPDSGSSNNRDLGDHGITGDGPFSSLLTRDKRSKRFKKRRTFWKRRPSSPKASHRVAKISVSTA